MTPSLPTYTIRKVTEIREAADLATIVFSDNDCARLLRSDSQYEPRLQLLRLLLEAGSPAGVLIDHTGEILDVAGVNRDIVVSIEDASVVPPAVGVWFGQEDGPLWLFQSHPRYGEVMATLAESGTRNQAIWYITRSGCVLDAMHLTPEADAALCRLFEHV